MQTLTTYKQNLFDDKSVNINILRERAYNYRWATLDEDVIPLTAADPDFPIAEEIRRAISDYSRAGYFSYGPAEGLPVFREAVSDWYEREKNVWCAPEHVLPVNSAAQALYITARHLLQHGDEVIIPNPVDFLFRKSIENAGAKAITCNVDMQTAEFDLQELEAAINPKTKAIFICNPNNPLGKLLSKNHLEAIGRLGCQYNLSIVSDEIWADIVYAPHTFHSISSLDKEFAKRTYIISGLSKNFGLAGLRVGYILAPGEAAYKALYESSKHASTAYGVSTISQIAAATALNDCKYWLDAFLEHLTEMRALVLDFLDKHSLFERPYPDSTYLAFPAIQSNDNSMVVTEKIHQQARVALIPGAKNFFESQSEGHIRICYATSEKILNEAFERINAASTSLIIK